MILRCDEHGYYGSENHVCPVCGEASNEFPSEDKRISLSKLMSGALRHFPDDLGLTLDENGWVELGRFVEAINSRREWAGKEEIQAVAETDPKGRFEITKSGGEEDKIRATYGHSIEVEIEGNSDAVPEELYHGTAPRNMDSIKEKGLQPMSRQEVHLSSSQSEAVKVGERHSDTPVLLVIDSRSLVEDGYEIQKRGEFVYTVSEVPPKYIDFDD